ncbi:sulfite exporter TauE/SafE family protein [Romboutsia weinsteinii]|uniref:Probable membrane transporter protein n=1 Tax=Romboutsia weinsteinii TaxID=2020949 RepID=A0A371J1A5_9FIRM|nr:sulfite exporter TauE/SafE family protein [Romboutsia weinsteinii]RDY26436.1 sulfite exporter TauE/SafE family protein [Romboutsia weinsteinii]
MVNIVRGLFVVLLAAFGVVFGKDYAKANKEGKLDDASFAKSGITGFVTDFFDTLGIGSFAPTIAMSKALKINIPDKIMPGTLNVAHTIPVVVEALIFTTVIEVESLTLISLIGAAVLGSYIGAGIISKMDERVLQLIMGLALAVTAVLMFLAHPRVNLMPGGGDAIGLSGINLILGIIGNFILGALMTAGIGLYSPCMAMVYFLGMSPDVAFPIMMGSCAMLMPVASMKFVKEGAYSRKASLAISIFGVLGVFAAAFFVNNMPMDLLKAVVVVVIAYTSFTMLKAASKKKDSVELERA